MYKYVCACGSKCYRKVDNEEIYCDTLYRLPSSPVERGFLEKGCGSRMHVEKWIDLNAVNKRYEMLQEGHNWEETGMLNRNLLPLRGTPAWDKAMAEGRIVKDKLGLDSMLSRDHNEYVRTLKDLGYNNAYGEGEVSRSRQQGEHLQHD